MRRGDGQSLAHVRITATVHCAPPGNKPTTEEMAQLLDRGSPPELALVTPSLRAIVALGGIAWRSTVTTLRAAGWQVPRASFGHGADSACHSPGGRRVDLLASYHPSQQNTFTGRLTEPMLDEVLARAGSAAGLDPRP